MIDLETKKDPKSNLKIDNETIMQQYRKGNLVFRNNENVVVVPPRVWSAFVNWYGQSKEIKRYVIEYPNKPDYSVR